MGGTLNKEQRQKFEHFLSAPFRLSLLNENMEISALFCDIDMASGAVRDAETGMAVARATKPVWMPIFDGMRCDLVFPSGDTAILKLFPVIHSNQQGSHFTLHTAGNVTSGRVSTLD